MIEPTEAIHAALASACLDGLLDPAPDFIELLWTYAHGDIDRDAFDTRLPQVVAAAVAADGHRGDSS